MSSVAALGRWTELAGYPLAGIEVFDASTPEAVRRAWDSLPNDVAVVLLTAEARRSLPDPLLPRHRLWAVIPG
jgi:vacuolar-type H+-ATPase subunit F/Vma7